MESIFLFLSTGKVGIVVDFIFKWMILGPMLIVDNFINPVTAVIGWGGWVMILFSLLLFSVNRRRLQKMEEEKPLNTS